MTNINLNLNLNATVNLNFSGIQGTAVVPKKDGQPSFKKNTSIETSSVESGDKVERKKRKN